MTTCVDLIGVDLGILNNKKEELQGLDLSAEEVTQMKTFQGADNGELVFQS